MKIKSKEQEELIKELKKLNSTIGKYAIMGEEDKDKFKGLYGVEINVVDDDVDVVLVSPTGQSVILMSDVGGSTDATGQNFVFDDAAASLMADAAFNPSGTYTPTNIGTGDNWPAPGPWCGRPLGLRVVRWRARARR